ncbi:AsnC family transcriptional regulator [Limnohabitans sp. 2KL-17]|uniref:Lrp/AsnC family transcriptional regulator n=1 Tax=Limnohabitans sp. 2KL-17 TaxID=1100704 RepID=UPI000D35E07E|nr:Lrp/AsnC family transcriptional regulator [Limnohabitans sp. 2KL-17]PUE53599.1 AsnC family transcriptional regulator [Limnohabitans sp. 2KL-17]
MAELKMDKIDRKLLTLLETDGRMSNAKLAIEVGLSPAACLRRVQRLESSQIIEGYTVRLNRSLVGGQQTVYIEISLDRQTEAAMAAFERAVAALPEVQECHTVAADYDYLLQVDVNDSSDYERLRRRELADLPHVQRMRSVFGLRCIKRCVAPSIRI